MEPNPYSPPSAPLRADAVEDSTAFGPVAPTIVSSFEHVRPWMNVTAAALAGCAVLVVGLAGFTYWKSSGVRLPLAVAMVVAAGGLTAAASFMRAHARTIGELVRTQSAPALDATIGTLTEVWRVLGFLVLTAMALGFGVRYALQIVLSH